MEVIPTSWEKCGNLLLSVAELILDQKGGQWVHFFCDKKDHMQVYKQEFQKTVNLGADFVLQVLFI